MLFILFMKIFQTLEKSFGMSCYWTTLQELFWNTINNIAMHLCILWNVCPELEFCILGWVHTQNMPNRSRECWEFSFHYIHFKIWYCSTLSIFVKTLWIVIPSRFKFVFSSNWFHWTFVSHVYWCFDLFFSFSLFLYWFAEILKLCVMPIYVLKIFSQQGLVFLLYYRSLLLYRGLNF